MQLAKLSDAVYLNLARIKAESPLEPLVSFHDEGIHLRPDQKQLLGPLANEPVPRSVAEFYHEAFGMMDGHYRILNNWLRAGRYGLLGNNPAVHFMWGMNDAYSAHAAGMNPFAPNNYGYMLRAAKAVAAYHLQEHPSMKWLADKVPGLDLSRDLEVFNNWRDKGAFKGAFALRGAALWNLAEATRAIMLDANRQPGAGAALRSILESP